MSGIQHSYFGCVSQVYSLWTVKLKWSTAKFWLKKVDSQLARLKYLMFGNEEIRQLELWNLAQQEILLLVPGEVLWRKCIGGLCAKITEALMWNHWIFPSPFNNKGVHRTALATPGLLINSISSCFSSFCAELINVGDKKILIWQRQYSKSFNNPVQRMSFAQNSQKHF